MDDQANTASTAFGLTSYPYWVVLDADGKVVTRLSGELDDSAIKQLLDGIASGNSTATTVAAGDSSNVGSGTTVAPSTTAAG
jgi:thioredoxin-like negative regulator of GroEL